MMNASVHQEIESLTQQLIKMKQLVAQHRALEALTVELEQRLEAEGAAREALTRQIHNLTESVESDKEERRILLNKITLIDGELASASHKQQALQEECSTLIAQRDAFKESLEKRSDELETAKKMVNDLRKQLDQVEQQLQERIALNEEQQRLQRENEQSVRHLGEQNVLKNQKIEALTSQVEVLEKEKMRLDEGYTRLRKVLEEREIEVKTAQQHLAKKVKEAARVNEQQEEAERRAERLQKELNDQRTVLDTLKTDLLRGQQREKLLQDQLKEQTTAMEVKAAKWEAEYFKLVEQWKHSESEVRTLRQLEEKHLQLRSLFAEIDRSFEQFGLKREEGGQASQSPAPTADLYALPQPELHVRQNLFDK